MRRLALWAWVLAFVCVVSAQGDRATITGTVRGPDGAPLAGAAVQAKQPQTGAAKRTVTGPDGRFTINALAAGSYDVAAAMPCCAYQPFAQPGVALQAGQTRQLEIRLSEGQSYNTY